MFVFFKHKTAYEMRISDWSSDVCSSDLVEPVAHLREVHAELGEHVRILRAFTGEQQAQLAGRIADTVLHAGARLERLGVRALDLFDRLFKLFAKVVVAVADQREALRAACRSEERRVGKECVSTFRSRC